MHGKRLILRSFPAHLWTAGTNRTPAHNHQVTTDRYLTTGTGGCARPLGRSHSPQKQNGLLIRLRRINNPFPLTGLLSSRSQPLHPAHPGCAQVTGNQARPSPLNATWQLCAAGQNGPRYPPVGRKRPKDKIFCCPPVDTGKPNTTNPETQKPAKPATTHQQGCAHSTAHQQ